jgi:hypothetical protein
VAYPVPADTATGRALRMLIDLIDTEILDRNEAAAAFSSAYRHKDLSAHAFTSLVDRKALQYIKLQELPRIGAEFAPETTTAREQSKVYKR